MRADRAKGMNQRLEVVSLCSMACQAIDGPICSASAFADLAEELMSFDVHVCEAVRQSEVG